MTLRQQERVGGPDMEMGDVIPGQIGLTHVLASASRYVQLFITIPLWKRQYQHVINVRKHIFPLTITLIQHMITEVLSNGIKALQENLIVLK